MDKHSSTQSLIATMLSRLATSDINIIGVTTDNGGQATFISYEYGWSNWGKTKWTRAVHQCTGRSLAEELDALLDEANEIRRMNESIRG